MFSWLNNLWNTPKPNVSSSDPAEESSSESVKETIPVQIIFNNRTYLVAPRVFNQVINPTTKSSHQSYSQLFKTTLESGISALIENTNLELEDIDLTYLKIIEYSSEEKDSRVILRYQSPNNGNKTYQIDLSEDLKIDEESKSSINTNIKPKYENIQELDTALKTYTTAMAILKGSLKPTISRADNEDAEYKPKPIELNISKIMDKKREDSIGSSLATDEKPPTNIPKKAEKKDNNDPFKVTEKDKTDTPNIGEAKQYFTNNLNDIHSHWEKILDIISKNKTMTQKIFNNLDENGKILLKRFLLLLNQATKNGVLEVSDQMLILLNTYIYQEDNERQKRIETNDKLIKNENKSKIKKLMHLQLEEKPVPLIAKKSFWPFW